MLGLDNSLLMGLIFGIAIGVYLGNKDIRAKVNAMIFKKKPEVKPPETPTAKKVD